jgi:hypothetical protein
MLTTVMMVVWQCLEGVKTWRKPCDNAQETESKFLLISRASAIKNA